MPKKILQDIVNASPSSDKEQGGEGSEAHVPFSVRRSQKRDRFSFFHKEDAKSAEEVAPPASTGAESAPAPSYAASRWLWMGAVPLAVGGTVALGLHLFASATIFVTPRTESLNIDHVFTARTEGVGLRYQTVAVEDTISKEVEATGEQQVDRKASGTIKIYNTYSTAPQRLITNTRFEDSKGRIYRIQKPVTVPGTTKKNGETVPGTIETLIYADFSGAEYNGEPADFTIPGFKGTPRYNGFYARSTTPLAGGFSGKVKIVPLATRTATEKELTESLRSSLAEKIRAEVPSGMLMYDGAVIFESPDTGSLGVEDEKKNTAVISRKGVMRAVVFDAVDMTNAISRELLTLADGEHVSIPDVSSLAVSPKDTAVWNPAGGGDIAFSVRGSVNVVWDIDVKAIGAAFAGTNKSDFISSVAKYENIHTADAILRPFWKRSFPKDASRIEVVVMPPTAPAAPAGREKKDM